MNSAGSEPRYVISVAARIVGIETHTLRYYERIGLVQPYRSEGNVRYYSEVDIERLRQIKTLMSDLGINLAGVEVVIRMVEKMTEMQNRIQEMEFEIQKLRESEIAIEDGLDREVNDA
ncbi:MAG: MerR family transcriptional regulator [Chloroflexota bacterium]|nr:MAG: MerR family transcriptional regulator [Chloroflexota bacterium]